MRRIRRLDSSHHRGSHKALIRPIPRVQRPARGLDAIIVPSGRSAAHLLPAARLAAGMDSRLVVFCSDRAIASEVRETVARLPGDPLIVAVPTDYEHSWLSFATDRHENAGLVCYPDLSLKRNLGLLLAKMLGWSRVLYLDDDIYGIDSEELTRLASALGPSCRAIGLKVDSHPDNSVVCHAYRSAGGHQETFVGANALLLDTGENLPFFPTIYNEDWLFLHEIVGDRKVGRAGTARQLPYDPFDHPSRAVAQEFGDVVGEGLMALLHSKAGAEREDPSFWEHRLEGRSILIDATLAGLEERGVEERGLEEHLLQDDRAMAAVDSLNAAKEALASVTSRTCTTFLDCWTEDLRRWEDTLSRLSRCRSLKLALSALELSTCWE